MDSLEEELLAVDAIYPGCVSRDTHSPRRLAIRPFFDTEPSAASLTLSMPQDYPDAPPTLLGHNGLSRSHILDALDTSWTPGEVCLYVLIDNLREHPTGSNTNVTQGSVRNATIQTVSSSSSDDGDDQDYQFAVSDPIVDRKSTFVGRAISVQSKAEAQAALLWLKQHNKKVAKATHNIVAWRLIENGVLMQGIPEYNHSDVVPDNDDDGEDAAGGRIAHLLEMTVRSLSQSPN
jgi:hypothetical protein